MTSNLPIVPSPPAPKKSDEPEAIQASETEWHHVKTIIRKSSEEKIDSAGDLAPNTLIRGLEEVALSASRDDLRASLDQAGDNEHNHSAEGKTNC